MASDVILDATRLGMQWKTYSPFLFCAHHYDDYPKGDDALAPAASLAGRHIGQDFDPSLPWRMYHGDKVPGFPAHPHRGFETVSIVRRGFIDHADSIGASARFGDGDVQWMTAGKGVVHSEMFPLVHSDKGNPTELFQIWLNLPKRSKMSPAHFQMIWRDDLAHSLHVDANGKTTTSVHVAGGALFPDAELSRAQTTAPPASWAAEADAHVRVVTIKSQAGAQFELSPTAPGVDRALYFFEGSSMTVNGRDIPVNVGLKLDGTQVASITVGDADAEFVLLEGAPIQEPVVQQGPFVMNTEGEIRQTMIDYQQTRFGGWPWPSAAPVHPRARGRFANYGDGRIEYPED